MNGVVNDLTSWVGRVRYAVRAAEKGNRLVQIDHDDAEHLRSTLQSAISEIARLELLKDDAEKDRDGARSVRDREVAAARKQLAECIAERKS